MRGLGRRGREVMRHAVSKWPDVWMCIGDLVVEEYGAVAVAGEGNCEP